MDAFSILIWGIVAFAVIMIGSIFTEDSKVDDSER